uniref:Uncharacterized protein n=1 Tax=Sphaerodactylus townsendi TaxID=933632 RepID=A0ACB8GB96_9SAUR
MMPLVTSPVESVGEKVCNLRAGRGSTALTQFACPDVTSIMDIVTSQGNASAELAGKGCYCDECIRSQLLYSPQALQEWCHLHQHRSKEATRVPVTWLHWSNCEIEINECDANPARMEEAALI